MASIGVKATLGRKISSYSYDSEINRDVNEANNTWVSLKLSIRQDDENHDITILAKRPPYEKLRDWRGEVTKLKHMLDQLKRSGVDEPEMSIFYLGHKKFYPYENKPPGIKIEEQNREVGLISLQQINLLYFDQGMEIVPENTLSMRMIEAIEVLHPQTGDIAFNKLLFYNLGISLVGLDLSGKLGQNGQDSN